ncbi:MAG: hypothetical protein MHM6MM_000949 [Cercozoa sp. M6MM]
MAHKSPLRWALARHGQKPTSKYWDRVYSRGIEDPALMRSLLDDPHLSKEITQSSESAKRFYGDGVWRELRLLDDVSTYQTRRENFKKALHHDAVLQAVLSNPSACPFLTLEALALAQNLLEPSGARLFAWKRILETIASLRDENSTLGWRIRGVHPSQDRTLEFLRLFSHTWPLDGSRLKTLFEDTKSHDQLFVAVVAVLQDYAMQLPPNSINAVTRSSVRSAVIKAWKNGSIPLPPVPVLVLMIRDTIEQQDAYINFSQVLSGLLRVTKRAAPTVDAVELLNRLQLHSLKHRAVLQMLGENLDESPEEQDSYDEDDTDSELQ